MGDIVVQEVEIVPAPIQEVRQNGNDVIVTVAWTPDCGALHIEDNPIWVGLTCPDGFGPDWHE